jgi:hypothetical protein
MQKTKCKKGDNPPGGGGMRGLVGDPTVAFELQSFLEECLMVFYRFKTMQTYNNREKMILEGRLGALGAPGWFGSTKFGQSIPLDVR